MKLTNLMKFLTSIIRLLGQRYMVLYDIKVALNLGITDCCKYGNYCSASTSCGNYNNSMSRLPESVHTTSCLS